MLKFKTSVSDTQVVRQRSASVRSARASSELPERANSTLEEMILKECRAKLAKDQLRKAEAGGGGSDSGCSGGGSPEHNNNSAYSSLNTSLQDVPIHHGRLTRESSYADTSSATGHRPVSDVIDQTLDFDTTSASFVVDEDCMKLESYPKLAEAPYSPWGEHEVLNVLREGRAARYSCNITVEIMQRLSHLLARPLMRVARESRRLGHTFLHCTKHEVQTAMKVTLSSSMYTSCIQASSRAIALHTVSPSCLKVGKSQKAGLRFSVGKFHRWMIDVEVAAVVEEQAAVCLAACMENLLEEMVLRGLQRQKLGQGVISTKLLDHGIDSNADFWGLVQPFDHLVCGRNASGMVCLPDELAVSEGDGATLTSHTSTTSGGSVSPQTRAVDVLLTTGATSRARLSEVMCDALVQWNDAAPRGGRSARLYWGRDARHQLWHFMKTSRCITNQRTTVKLSPLHSNTPADERVYTMSPPLVEWIRVASSFTEHRRCHMIDADDVMQAARVILPRRSCAPRFFRPIDPVTVPRTKHLKQHLEHAQQYALLQVILSPESAFSLEEVRKDNLNKSDVQGLTPLMYASAYGDVELVTRLLAAGADSNVRVAVEYKKNPHIHPELRNWTALNFAVTRGSIPILKLLLENGAHVEGASYGVGDNHSITPLQLAAAAGKQEVVSWLLSQGGDPYLRTAPKAGMSVAESQNGYTGFTLAAMHGHRHIIKKLIAQPIKSGYEILSLAEILSENADKRSSISSTKHVYQTIDDVFADDKTFTKPEELPPKKKQTAPTSARLKFTELQYKTLQEGLYHASENSHLDLALDIRHMGIPWTPYAWSRCVETGHYLQRRGLIKNLLTDFTTCSLEDITTEFVYECLPLLFEILKQGKNDIISQQVAMVLSTLYGKASIPCIPELRRQISTRIDPKYVNCRELSDVHFVIEGKVFFAHRLVLVNASDRFRTMLTGATRDGKVPTIELGDIKYQIFEKMMDYLYNGGMCFIQMDTKTLMELYGAAHFFHLDGLQRHCERMFSKTLAMDNCVAIYKIAKLYSSVLLLSYCEGYFLQNFQKALAKNKIFKDLLFNTKTTDYELIDGLLATLSQRVEDKIMEKQRLRSSTRR